MMTALFNLAAQMTAAALEVAPEGTLMLLCAFVPSDEPNEWHGMLRVNVEDASELFTEVERMIANARVTPPVDLRDTIGGMQ